METKKSPCVEAQMRIRKPTHEVFEAFIDPELTKHFWFTKGSGRLEAGKTVTWEWEMYGQSATVAVKEIIPNKRISVEWGEPMTSEDGIGITMIDFDFQELSDRSTYVVITNYGFAKSGEELLEDFKGLTGGFTTVLDGLKAFLEHNIDLNLIADKFPAEVLNQQ